MLGGLFLMGSLGMAVGIVLALASKIFYVWVDPKIEVISEILPGANCGGCGYPGCNATATAMVAGKAKVNVCVAGGPEVAEKVARVMGLPVEYTEVQFAERGCRCGSLYDPMVYDYIGVQDCRAAFMIDGGPNKSEFSCLGYGTCARACPFDAITMGNTNLPRIDYKRCTGCGICEQICPKNAIRVVSESYKVLYWNQLDHCAAPCQATCPTQIDIPRYLGFIADGNFEDALRVIKEHMPMPLSIGRICPAPCEDKCRRKEVDEAVNINDLKRFAADLEYRSGKHTPVFVHPDTGHKVAVIGGGPAGITCAYYLRRLGHAPTVFESLPELGGALRYGIPEYRLPKSILNWEIEGMLSIGIEARLHATIGRDYSYESIMQEGFEAVFIATGTPRGLWTKVAGEDLQGVSAGIDFLRDVGLSKKIRLGKRVIVIGGGNVAIDVALSAMRLSGPEKIHMVCLEERDEMPAWEHEVHDALDEGVILYNGWGPYRILGQDGKVKGVEFKKSISVFDETGRFNPKYDETQIITIEADDVLITIGQGTDLAFIKSSEGLSGLEITPRGTLVINEETMQTSLPHIFSSGEIVTGPDIAIQAIAGGRRAAWAIHQYLDREEGSDGIIKPPSNLRKTSLDLVDKEELAEVPRIKREVMPRLLVGNRRKNWQEVNLGLSEEQAIRAAKRCLNCCIYSMRIIYEATPKDSYKKVA